MDAVAPTPPTIPGQGGQPALFDTDLARWEAVQRRDPAADGCFVYAVATTGVFCHPSCAARPARRVNVSFHPDRAAAVDAGFRPCKRCRPDQPPRAARDAALIAASCRMIERQVADGDDVPSLGQLAAAAGLSPFHFHRLFRRVAGVTPKAYASAQRGQRVQDGLRTGASVTAALYGAGFNSAGRFYAAADGLLGMAPSTYRAGGPGETIHHAAAACSLGTVLVAATGRGICAILLGDAAGSLAADLQARFPQATLMPADDATDALLGRVVALVDAPGAPLDKLPLDIRGTAFQRRVWEALRAIPAGRTQTYAQVAASLGSPRAVRAVAGACAANKLAVAVPCHRVVASNGGLGGYRWGIGRKQALLAREQG